MREHLRNIQKHSETFRNTGKCMLSIHPDLEALSDARELEKHSETPWECVLSSQAHSRALTNTRKYFGMRASGTLKNLRNTQNTQKHLRIRAKYLETLDNTRKTVAEQPEWNGSISCCPDWRHSNSSTRSDNRFFFKGSGSLPKFRASSLQFAGPKLDLKTTFETGPSLKRLFSREKRTPKPVPLFDKSLGHRQTLDTQVCILSRASRISRKEGKVLQLQSHVQAEQVAPCFKSFQMRPPQRCAFVSKNFTHRELAQTQGERSTQELLKPVLASRC